MNENVQRQLQPYLEPLPELFIEDNNDYAMVAEQLTNIKGRRKEVDDLRRTVTRPLDEAKANLQAMFKPVLERFDAEEKRLKRLMTDYDAMLERKRREIEARLRDEAAAEARRLEERAVKLEAKGKEEQAEAVRDAKPTIPVVLVDKPKVSGVSTRTVWKAEIVDFNKFIEFVYQHKNWHYIQVNESALDAMARAARGNIQVPGVEFKEEQIIVARKST